MGKIVRVYRRQRAIPQDPAARQPDNSRDGNDPYQDEWVECTQCGKRIVWSAEDQRYWYEDVKASRYAKVSLRCDVCRERGRHARHRQKQKAKARQRFAGNA